MEVDGDENDTAVGETDKPAAPAEGAEDGGTTDQAAGQQASDPRDLQTAQRGDGERFDIGDFVLVRGTADSELPHVACLNRIWRAADGVLWCR